MQPILALYIKKIGHAACVIHHMLILIRYQHRLIFKAEISNVILEYWNGSENIVSGQGYPILFSFLELNFFFFLSYTPVQQPLIGIDFIKPLQIFLELVQTLVHWSGRRATALRLVGCGYDSQLGHTKDCQSGTHCHLAWPALWELNHPMIRGRGTAIAHYSLRGS